MRGNLRLRNNQERREEFSATGSRALGARDKSTNNKKLCLLTEEMVEVMKENFDKLDRFEDLVVPRAELVQAIRKDVRAKNFMNKGVVYLPKVNKQISFSKVLHQIEQEEFIRADKLDAGDSNYVSSKKYISWKNFMDYFLNYSRSLAPTEQDLKKDTGDDQDILDVPKSLKEKMKSIFNELKDEDGYVKSYDYLNKLKSDPMIVNNLEAQIRSRARNGDIPSEKLRETLSRIEQQIDDYTDWEEFLQFFTRRGVPLAVELTKKIPTLTSHVAPLLNAKEIGSMVSVADKVNSALGNLSNIPALNQVQNLSVKPPGSSTWVGAGQGTPDTPSHEHATHHGTKPGSASLSHIPPLNATAIGPYQGGKAVDFVVGDNLDHTKLQEYARGGQSVDLLAETRKDFPAVYGNYLKQNPLSQTQLGQNNTNTSIMATQMNQHPAGPYASHPGDQQYQLPPGFLEAQQQHQQQQQGNMDPHSINSNGQFYPESYLPRSHSANAYQEDDPYIIDDYVVYGDDGKTHKITVPFGLKFEAREDRRSKSLKHKKFQEYISQKRKEEEEALKFQFRAKSIPDAVKQPLYSKIMAEQEHRREEVRKNSIAITRANEKPFSFYERDKNKSKKFKEDFGYHSEPFKAKEVPWFCSTELYSKERDFKENQRVERINRRAQESLATSKLPPRMEKHEQQRKQNMILGEQRAKIGWDDECTFQPGPAKRMPDFERAQRHFQTLLDKKRSHKKPTHPVPFNFESNKKIPQIHYLETDNELIKKEKETQRLREENERNLERMRQERERSSHKENGASFVPNSTKSFTMQVDKTKKDRLEREKKRQAELAKQREKEERHKTASKKFRQTLAADEALKQATTESKTNSSRRSDSAIDIKTKWRQDEKNYQNTLSQLKEKIESRPTIYQTCRKVT